MVVPILLTPRSSCWFKVCCLKFYEPCGRGFSNSLRALSPRRGARFGLFIFTEYCHTLGISLEDHDSQGNRFLTLSIQVNPTDVSQRIIAGIGQQSATPMAAVQEGPIVRAGRKAKMAERIKVGDNRLDRYLLRISDNGKAKVICTSIQVEDNLMAIHVYNNISDLYQLAKLEQLIELHIFYIS